MLKNAKPQLLAVVFAALGAALLISMVLAVNIGAVDVRPDQVFRIICNKLAGSELFPVSWSKAQESIIWSLRFPKVLVAACTGSGLSLAGILMQALTRNPMAEPYILGISSGASTGAVSAILIGSFPLLGSVSVSAGAFLGALLSAVIVFVIAGTGGGNTTRLILVGLALSAMFSALTNVLLFLSPDSHKVKSAMFWMTGSFSGIQWSDVLPAVLTLLVGLAAVVFMSQELDALLLGEDAAKNYGVHTAAVKTVLIIVSTLITGILVSMSGVIGFVGLVVPHVSRGLVGAAHRRLIPLSALLGGIFMIWADVIARVSVAPEELAVGVVTALAGAPFFLFMLRKSRYSFGS